MENIGGDLIRGSIDTIILRCLHRGEMYGLEICNLIKEASSGTYILKQPTLYSSLKRLEQRKMISSFWRDSAIGGRRHYYKLTELGIKSFVGKKASWMDTKDVIDSLVDGNISGEKPKQKSAPVILDSPTQIEFQYPTKSITPYNPFAESDEYLTLPVGLKTEPKTKLKKNETEHEKETVESTDTQVLQKYALNSEPEHRTEQTPHSDSVGTSVFAKYLSPGDYTVVAANKTITANAKAAKVSQFDVEIRPFVKHFGTRRRVGDFVFINKLQCIAALVVTCLIAAALMYIRNNLKAVYTSNEQIFFTAAYVATGIYFGIYTSRWFLSPKAKKLSANSFREHFIRLGVTVLLAVAVLCINILTGLNFVNSPDYLVFWIIPCVLASAVYIEGLIQMLLRKSKIFAV